MTLTEKGKALEERLIGSVPLINEIATRGIDRTELDVCARVLTRMSDNLSAEWERLQQEAKEGRREMVDGE